MLPNFRETVTVDSKSEQLPKWKKRNSRVQNTYLQIGKTILNQSREPLDENLHHLRPIQHQRNQQKPRVEPQLLKPNPSIPTIPILLTKIPPVEDGLVENVGLEEEPGLAGAHVLTEVELADPGRDLADLPPPEARLYEFLAVFLLVLPEAHVGLEDLVEVVVRAGPAVGRYVADPGELPVRVLG